MESVSGADGGGATVRLTGGGTLAATRGVIVAADGPAAGRLLGAALTGGSPSKAEPGVGTSCIYFS